MEDVLLSCVAHYAKNASCSFLSKIAAILPDNLKQESELTIIQQLSNDQISKVLKRIYTKQKAAFADYCSDNTEHVQDLLFHTKENLAQSIIGANLEDLGKILWDSPTILPSVFYVGYTSFLKCLTKFNIGKAYFAGTYFRAAIISNFQHSRGKSRASGNHLGAFAKK